MGLKQLVIAEQELGKHRGFWVMNCLVFEETSTRCVSPRAERIQGERGMTGHGVRESEAMCRKPYER